MAFGSCFWELVVIQKMMLNRDMPPPASKAEMLSRTPPSQAASVSPDPWAQVRSHRRQESTLPSATGQPRFSTHLLGQLEKVIASPHPLFPETTLMGWAEAPAGWGI